MLEGIEVSCSTTTPRHLHRLYTRFYSRFLYSFPTLISYTCHLWIVVRDSPFQVHNMRSKANWQPAEHGVLVYQPAPHVSVEDTEYALSDLSFSDTDGSGKCIVATKSVL